MNHRTYGFLKVYEKAKLKKLNSANIQNNKTEQINSIQIQYWSPTKYQGFWMELKHRVLWGCFSLRDFVHLVGFPVFSCQGPQNTSTDMSGEEMYEWRDGLKDTKTETITHGQSEARLTKLSQLTLSLVPSNRWFLSQWWNAFYTNASTWLRSGWGLGFRIQQL